MATLLNNLTTVQYQVLIKENHHCQRLLWQNSRAATVNSPCTQAHRSVVRIANTAGKIKNFSTILKTQTKSVKEQYLLYHKYKLINRIKRKKWEQLWVRLSRKYQKNYRENLRLVVSVK